MAVTLSVQDQMLTRTGTVTDVQYVDYVTPEGMECFRRDGQRRQSRLVQRGDDGDRVGERTAQAGEIYAAGDAALEYNRAQSITAGASGELTQVNVTDYGTGRGGRPAVHRRRFGVRDPA